MQQERAIEVKVGLLVLVSVVILVAFVFILGDFNLGRKGMMLFVDFETSAHLKAGAPVKINGVDAGKVVKIAYWGGSLDPGLTKDPRRGGKPVWIRVQVELDKKMGATIRRNARFVITTKGVLGEKYIEISPGSIDQPKVHEGEKLKGTDLPPLGDMMLDLSDVGKTAGRILKRVDATLAQNPDILGKILRNANATLTNANKFVKEVREQVRPVISQVKPIVEQVRGSLRKVDRILDRADQALRSANYALKGGEDVRVALRNVRQITVNVKYRVNTLLNRVDRFMRQGNKLADTGVGILADVRTRLPKITGNLTEILERGKSVITKIDSGKGTVAQLINEEELYEIVKETLKNLKRHPWKLVWRQ